MLYGHTELLSNIVLDEVVRASGVEQRPECLPVNVYPYLEGLWVVFAPDGVERKF